MSCGALIPRENSRIYTSRNTINKRISHHTGNSSSTAGFMISNSCILITVKCVSKVYIYTINFILIPCGFTSINHREKIDRVFASPVIEPGRNLHARAFTKLVGIFRRSFWATIALVMRIDPRRIVFTHQGVQVNQAFNIVTSLDNAFKRILFQTKALLEIDLPICGMLVIRTFEPAAGILRERRHSHDIVVRIDNERSRRIFPRAQQADDLTFKRCIRKIKIFHSGTGKKPCLINTRRKQVACNRTVLFTKVMSFVLKATDNLHLGIFRLPCCRRDNRI